MDHDLDFYQNLAEHFPLWALLLSEARQLEVVRLLDQGHCVHDLDLESHLIWLQLQSLSQACVSFTTWRNFTTWNRDGSLAE